MTTITIPCKRATSGKYYDPQDDTYCILGAQDREKVRAQRHPTSNEYYAIKSVCRDHGAHVALLNDYGTNPDTDPLTEDERTMAFAFICLSAGLKVRFTER